jgi:hypothetical protein
MHQHMAHTPIPLLSSPAPVHTLSMYTEALLSPQASAWHNAMQLEHQSLIHNGTYQLVTLLPGHKAI